ncbi:MAG: dynamin family protein [Campylobacterota bacterium]|nr:dynamin family protein [Campylobacterota bacterium]
MLSKLNEYYKSLNEISLTNSDLDEKREKLKSLIDSYHKQTQGISLDKNLLNQNKEMATMLTSTVSSLKEATDSWVINLKEMMDKEKFRSDLENYFIVIIFGKVKAGKSTLGNFIAHNRLASQDIRFFKYDEAGKEQTIKQLQEIDDESGFATANTECTVEIQGFKLSGMAWIDTPGLGSMVEENGNLAKEYIQSADYVIYPTNSSSPLQQDEKEQLKELFEQNKKVTICITKSDVTEEDEVDGKLVEVLLNKTKSNRSQQEKWVKSDMDEILGANDNGLLGDVISMSVHTAKYGLENKDRVMFEESNIIKFYELMTDVVKNKAKSLKENTPYDSLVSFIDNSISGSGIIKDSLSIEKLKENIKKFESEIEDGIERFNNLKKNLNSDITVHVDSIIAQYSSSLKSSDDKANNGIFGIMGLPQGYPYGFHNKNLNSEANNNANISVFDTIDSELEKTISTMIDKNINEILKDFSTILDNLTTTLSSTDNFNIEDNYETLTVSYVDNSWYNPGGIFGNQYSSKSEIVKIGDNKQETIANFKANRLESYMGVAEENYKNIQEQFFTPLLNIAKEINSDIDSLENSIVEFKHNLK